MKKVNYLVLLIVVAFMFSGCAVNKAPFQDYPAVTEVQLNQANYRIVGTAQGYSRQVYVFGIGGLSKKSLKENAIMDMYEKANLEGSQAIVNITTALTVSGVVPFYASQRASARGTIIEFLQDNEQPTQSVKSPYNTNPQRTIASEQKKEAQIQSTQSTVNKYYIAWLMKTGKLTTDNKKLAELKNLFSTKELAELSETLEERELKILLTGYDKELERYAGRVE